MAVRHPIPPPSRVMTRFVLRTSHQKAMYLLAGLQ